jgi:hypothetical protein
VASPRRLAHVARTDGSFESGGRHGTRNTLIGIEFGAMSILSLEQRRQIEQEGFMPIDDGAFVVLRADLYDRIRSLIDREDLTIDEQRRLLSELGKSVGWDDPAMDVYNDL